MTKISSWMLNITPKIGFISEHSTINIVYHLVKISEKKKERLKRRIFYFLVFDYVNLVLPRRYNSCQLIFSVPQTLARLIPTLLQIIAARGELNGKS